MHATFASCGILQGSNLQVLDTLLLAYLEAEDAHALSQAQLLLAHNSRHRDPRGIQESKHKQQVESGSRGDGGWVECHCRPGEWLHRHIHPCWSLSLPQGTPQDCPEQPQLLLSSSKKTTTLIDVHLDVQITAKAQAF